VAFVITLTKMLVQPLPVLSQICCLLFDKSESPSEGSFIWWSN